MCLHEVMILETSNCNHRIINHHSVLVPAESFPDYSVHVVYREGLDVKLEGKVPGMCIFLRVKANWKVYPIVSSYCTLNLQSSLLKVHIAVKREKQ